MQTTTLDRADAPRTARQTVAQCCADAGAGPECTDSSELMTSEVVTNALVHGTGPVTLAVDCGSARVRVEVGDRSAGVPRVRAEDQAAEGGRGMLIVDALASDWGVHDTPTGKIVWFEIAAQP